jgi:hypothetical protein
MTKTETCRRGALAALLAGTIAAAAAAPAAHAEEAAAAGPVELTERQMDRVTAGGVNGRPTVTFVMKHNSSSPGLVRCPDPRNC